MYQPLLVLRNKMGVFLIATLFFFVLFPSQSQAQLTQWVGTWGTAPYEAGNNTPPSPFLANNTLRQIVRVSIGGDTLRVKFSNRTSPTPVTMHAVNISVSVDSSTSVIEPSTLTSLSFGGSEAVTMAAYSEVTSDPVAFALQPGQHLAITIYYGAIETASSMTFHYGSRTNSYILTGDQSSSADFAGATSVERWYNLSSIDVLASSEAGAVAVLGNSITDGYGIHNGANKWPDTFSENLLANTATAQVSVLNVGIGATWLSTSGVNRFQQDVMEQSGLRWVVIFYGVNDIGGGASAATVINAYRSLITQAHAQNIRIYGATITPFNGHSYYSATREAVRLEVNEWIRTSGNFDKVIDFDKAIRDPNDPSRMQAAYSNDWLHPSMAGYNFLGESVDVNLFLGADTTFAQPSYTTFYLEPECATVGEDWNTVEDESASNGKYVTVKPGTESTASAPTDSAGLIYIPFSVDTATSFTVFGRLNNPSYDDDSFWIKMDDGEFALYNGLVTTGWQWVNLGAYTLAKGEHRLAIGYREDGATLDKIAITNSQVNPSGLGDEAVNTCSATNTETEVGTPTGFLLQQNYPNPFNPSTMIGYQLSANSGVKLAVYDALGREVSVLVNGVQTAGKYEQPFDATQLSSGIYYYRLVASIGGNETKKMLLLK